MEKYTIDFRPFNKGNGKYSIIAIIKNDNDEYHMSISGPTFDSETAAWDFINNNRAILLAKLGLPENVIYETKKLSAAGDASKNTSENTTSRNNSENTTTKKTNNSKSRAIKIEVSDSNPYIKYHAVKGEDGKYHIRVTYFNNKEVIDKPAFDTLAELRRYLEENHKRIEKLIYENEEKIRREKEKNGVSVNDNILEVTVPGQKENIRYYVVKGTDPDEYCNFYFIRTLLVDLSQTVDFTNKFYSQQDAKRYIENNYAEIEKESYKIINNTNRGNNNEQSRSKSSRILGYLLTAGAGALTLLLMIWAFKSCKGCNVAACSPVVMTTNTPSPTPTNAPTSTPTPSPTPVTSVISMDDLDRMAKDVFNEYMKNPLFASLNNGGLSGSTITVSEIRNGLVISNIDDLSVNSYDTFRQAVGNSQPDAFLTETDYLMQNMMASNMSCYFAKKYDPNSDKKLENLLWLSPMLIDKDDQKVMQEVEDKIKAILQADLNDDGNKVITLGDELRDMLNDQGNKNRGLGFDRVLFHELEVVLNCANNSLSQDQDVYDNLLSIKETERESTYVAILDILSNSNNYATILDILSKPNNYECSISGKTDDDYYCYYNEEDNSVAIDSTLVRTRHI